MPTFIVGSGVGDNYATLLFPIVDVDWFKQAVMGALFELTDPVNWIEMGDVAVSFAVEESAQMIDGFQFMNFNPFPVGIVLPFGSDIAPNGYLLCDGSTYDIGDYPELFDVIGYVFGGSGVDFVVPDLRDRTVVSMGSVFDFKDDGGEIDHQLSTSEIPSHTHSIPLTTSLPAQAGVGFAGDVTVPVVTSSTGSTGGDGAHNNMQPFLTLNYVIYAGRV